MAETKPLHPKVRTLQGEYSAHRNISRSLTKHDEEKTLYVYLA